MLHNKYYNHNKQHVDYSEVSLLETLSCDFCAVQSYNQIKEKVQIKFHQVKIKHCKEIL